MKRLTAVLILALAALSPAVHPAIAQDSEITAGDVVDRETLKAFVLAAAAPFTSLYADKATSLAEYLAGKSCRNLEPKDLGSRGPSTSLFFPLMASFYSTEIIQSSRAKT